MRPAGQSSEITDALISIFKQTHGLRDLQFNDKVLEGRRFLLATEWQPSGVYRLLKRHIKNTDYVWRPDVVAKWTMADGQRLGVTMKAQVIYRVDTEVTTVVDNFFGKYTCKSEYVVLDYSVLHRYIETTIKECHVPL